MSVSPLYDPEWVTDSKTSELHIVSYQDAEYAIAPVLKPSNWGATFSLQFPVMDETIVPGHGTITTAIFRANTNGGDIIPLHLRRRIDGQMVTEFYVTGNDQRSKQYMAISTIDKLGTTTLTIAAHISYSDWTGHVLVVGHKSERGERVTDVTEMELEGLIAVLGVVKRMTIEGDWRAVIYHDVTPRSTENSVRYLTFKAGRFLEDLGKAPVGELLVDILGSEGDDIMTMAIERVIFHTSAFNS